MTIGITNTPADRRLDDRSDDRADRRADQLVYSLHKTTQVIEAGTRCPSVRLRGHLRIEEDAEITDHIGRCDDVAVDLQPGFVDGKFTDVS